MSRSDAARTDARAECERLQRACPAEHVLGSRADGDADQLQPVGQLAGDVLGGVHGQIDLPAGERVLELGDPARLVLAGHRASA